VNSVEKVQRHLSNWPKMRGPEDGSHDLQTSAVAEQWMDWQQNEIVGTFARFKLL